MLIGGLSVETVKERVEKHPPPENCKFLTVTMVNEKIWELLPRKSQAVDLAFQLVQEPLLQGISASTNLVGKLVKDVTDGKTPNTRDVLNHVMDSVTMLGNTKRRELIKPELNPPYTRLSKEDIAVSTKLFGDDLSKHLKDMSEAKKAGGRCKNLIPTVPIGVQCTRKKGILADSSLTIMTGHKALATNQPTPSFFGGKAAHQHCSGKSSQPATTTPTTKVSIIQL